MYGPRKWVRTIRIINRSRFLSPFLIIFKLPRALTKGIFNFLILWRSYLPTQSLMTTLYKGRPRGVSRCTEKRDGLFCLEVPVLLIKSKTVPFPVSLPQARFIRPSADKVGLLPPLDSHCLSLIINTLWWIPTHWRETFPSALRLHAFHLMGFGGVVVRQNI